ncbi:DUF2948 family protein [Puniceibacterium sediminis]|uniref:DUF2948 domain-containing protein n=1 Tax=Puniceibacterium sediminis TaxID=1608407 RepID=A0A238X189_9RHOB|nr:DUF2948 family protein [Puniceibacterium sediminis]SNR52368.1 Protein of unknown function [Puniceibacterium sediminis]
MTEDARFEDGTARPLNLGAMDVEDLGILSALAQDAVFPISEMTWQPKSRRLALLVNRMRWEDRPVGKRPPERVQSVLLIENVMGVGSQGIDRSDRDTILSLLSVTFEPGPDASGNVLLTLAGDGALRAQVEALDVTLKDVTRPYVAPSGKTPSHPD